MSPLESALTHHRQGRLAEAERAYRLLLNRDPRNFEAQHLLGVLCYQTQRLTEAEQRLRAVAPHFERSAVFCNNFAEVLRRLGNATEAVGYAERAVRLNPQHAPAWNNLGLILTTLAKFSSARGAFRKALDVSPDYIEAANNWGILEQTDGAWDAAEERYRFCLRLRPDWAPALSNLGNLLVRRKRAVEAIEFIERSLALQPAEAESWFALGRAYEQSKRPDDACAAYQRALQIRPQHVGAAHNLAVVLSAQGNWWEAEQWYRRALQQDPGYELAWANLVKMLRRIGRRDDAQAVAQQALQRNPSWASVHHALALIFADANQLDAAEREARHAAELRPDVRMFHGLLIAILRKGRHYEMAFAEAEKALAARERAPTEGEEDEAEARLEVHNAIANLFLDLGDVERALQHYEAALKVRASQVVYSNFLFAQNYRLERDGRGELARHRAWVNFGEAAPGTIGGGPSVRAKPARLRIAYYSPDLRRHSVACFVAALFRAHDRRRFEIIVLSDVAVPDVVTAELQRHVETWHDVTSFSNEQLAAMIRREEFDLVVDLAGHTAGGRLGALQQVSSIPIATYLGYPNTTGVPAVRFRLTDELSDPSPWADAAYSEQLVRMPQTAWCYDPLEGGEQMARVARSGRVTFGSFQNLAKVTDEMLRAWAAILDATGESELLLKSPALADPWVQEQWRKRCARCGLSAAQVRFQGFAHGTDAHLAAYTQADIALDTFPYNGTTTTCEALWMGTPVVTLAGSVHRSRVGLSLLTNVGLEALVAANVDDYVRIAVHLARNPPERILLSEGLRERLKNSALMDAGRFVRALEDNFQRMIEGDRFDRES